MILRFASTVVLALLIAIIDVEFFNYAVYGGLYHSYFLSFVISTVAVVAINIVFKPPNAHMFERVYWGQVYVKPEFRGFGFGKRLAEAIKVRPLRFNASELQTVKNWPGRYLPEEIAEG